MVTLCEMHIVRELTRVVRKSDTHKNVRPVSGADYIIRKQV